MLAQTPPCVFASAAGVSLSLSLGAFLSHYLSPPSPRPFPSSAPASFPHLLSGRDCSSRATELTMSSITGLQGEPFESCSARILSNSPLKTFFELTKHFESFEFSNFRVTFRFATISFDILLLRIYSEFLVPNHKNSSSHQGALFI